MKGVNSMKFGDNLKLLRKNKKMSQEELAERMNVSRQSVSKWETGEAYPEINNILQLCKVFNCKINDLVNDSIIDMDEMDEEVKTSAVKFKESKQKKVKGISKAVSVIASICRVIIIVVIPFVILAMCVMPIVINSIEVKDNEITALEGSKIKITKEKEKYKIGYGKRVLIADVSVKNANDVLYIFNNRSNIYIISILEISLGLLIAYLIIMSYTFNNLKKLFNNIYAGDTPFTLENVNYIKTMAKLLIAAIVVGTIGGGLLETLTTADMSMDIELVSVLQILFIFVMGYIFEYGYEIQRDSNGKMYGDVNE